MTRKTADDPQRGPELFRKTCAQCPRLEHFVAPRGPELTEAGHRNLENLLSNMLDRKRAINPASASYKVEWSPDEIVTGILQSETSEAIPWLQAQGIEAVIPRAKLKRRESTGLSLMPAGLEAGRTP